MSSDPNQLIYSTLESTLITGPFEEDYILDNMSYYGEHQRLLKTSPNSDSEGEAVLQEAGGIRQRTAGRAPEVDTAPNLPPPGEGTSLEEFMMKADPTLPGLTFRFWVLSIFFGLVLAFSNQFFYFRSTPLNIGGFIVQLLAFPLGVFLANVLPSKQIEFLGQTFSLNPGPFNVKEHGLISVCAGACAGTAYAMDIVVVKRMYYKEPLTALGSVLLLVSTQFLGYGFAGLYRRLLVRPARMVWPTTLVAVAVFQTLHQGYQGQSSVRSLRRFFAVACLFSFGFYFVPGYLFTILASISFLCLFFPNNKMAQQLGSGVTGLGIGTISLDWNSFTSYIGSPLITPFWAQVNTMVGFVLVCWVIVPLGYYSDVWGSLRFPIFTAGLFDNLGHVYDRLRITPNHQFSESAYQNYSPVHLSFFFAFTYGVSFATLTALITHTILYHGKELLQGFKSYFGQGKEQQVDPHALAMDRYPDQYPDVPVVWYLGIFLASLVLALIAVESHGLSLPWWGLLVAVGISFVFTLPIGIVTAITNQTPGLNVLTEFVAGYMFPGLPIANVTFKVYGFITMLQALTFLADLKLGQYLKIPPRQMLFAQCLGTFLAVVVNLATAEWLMNVIPDICTPKGFPWTCPSTEVFYSASVIWGLIGPAKMFGPGSLYYPLLSAFAIGFLLPIPFYFLAQTYKNTWLDYVHIPIVVSATASLPPARTGNFATWFFVGFVFHKLIKRRYPRWYERYTMILSAALDTGVAISGIIIFFLFEHSQIVLKWWGNDNDFHCPLSKLPGS